MLFRFLHDLFILSHPVGQDQHHVIGRHVPVDGDRVKRFIDRALQSVLKSVLRDQSVGRDKA